MPLKIFSWFTNGSGSGPANSFSTVQPEFGTSPAASSPNDTLTLTSSDDSVLITGDSTTDTVDYTRAGQIRSYVGASLGHVVGATNYLLGMKDTSAARAVSLMHAASFPLGKVLYVKDESLACSVNNISIISGGGLIEGSSQYILNIDGEAVSIYSNGTAYFVF